MKSRLTAFLADTIRIIKLKLFEISRSETASSQIASKFENRNSPDEWHQIYMDSYPSLDFFVGTLNEVCFVGTLNDIIKCHPHNNLLYDISPVTADISKLPLQLLEEISATKNLVPINHPAHKPPDARFGSVYQWLPFSKSSMICTFLYINIITTEIIVSKFGDFHVIFKSYEEYLQEKEKWVDTYSSKQDVDVYVDKCYKCFIYFLLFNQEIPYVIGHDGLLFINGMFPF